MALSKKEKKYRRSRRQGRMLAWVVRFLALTVRFRALDPHGILDDLDRTKVFALWHNRLFSGVMFARKYLPPPHRMVGLISPSADGEILVSILESFGFSASRGSSSREGSRGTKEIVKRIKDGEHAVVTPDGPRGPCYQLHSGVLAIAKLSGVPLVPLRFELSWKYRFNSWDRFQIPFPFALCTLVIEEPMMVTEENEEEIKARLIEALRT